MSGDLQASLLAGASPEKPHPSYVLVFPNTFTSAQDSSALSANDTISCEEARERLKVVFSSLSPGLVDRLKQELPWSHDSYPEPTLSRRHFQQDMIGMVLWLLSSRCGITSRLYYSRDKDEIFCALDCPEERLRRRAAHRGYRLQMRNPKDEKWETYKYMKVFPYVAFAESIHEISVLKHYNEDGEPATDGSLFTLVDKTRLIFGMISKVLSLDSLVMAEVLKDHYCVHHSLHLTYLKQKWATMRQVCASQPFTRLRNYFGERVSLYFAWINFYCNAMMLPAAVGLAVFLYKYFEDLSTKEDMARGLAVAFSLFLALWATFFDQLWIREEKILAWKWGSVGYSVIEEQRGEFKGEWGHDDVTGHYKKQSESSCLSFFKRTIGASVVLLFVALVIAVVVGVLFYKGTIKGGDPMEGYMWGIINAVWIKVMNFIYYIIARKLNDWENHETESEYTETLSGKLFLFRFVNCYVSLFYIAFVQEHWEGCPAYGCTDALALQLATIFVTNMALNVLELGIPYTKDKLRIWLEEREIMRKRELTQDLRTSMSPTERQAKLESYETPLEDYMEMVCQYGYVVMFSSAFPLISLFALIEILIEIRVDAWKLCHLTRRPFPQRAESIGIWCSILQVVSFMGITTNVALILFGTDMFTTDRDERWLWFLAFEHCFIVIKLVLAMVIPDEPSMVKYGLMWSKRKAEELLFAKKVDLNKQILSGLLSMTLEECSDSFRLNPQDLAKPWTQDF